MTEPASPSGTKASALKRRNRKLLTRLRIPPDALPGSLVLSHRRCGKPGCHCAEGTAHPFYSLTFRIPGKKQVEAVPAEWIDAVRPAVDAAHGFKDAVSELFAINAQLLVLARQQRRRHAPVDRSSE